MRWKLLTIGLIVILAIVAVSPFIRIVGATEQIYASFTSGDDSGDDVYGVNWKAMTFIPSADNNVTKVSIKMYRVGSPSMVTVSIRATSSDVPTGGDLSSGTVDGNTLTTGTGGAWYNITMTSYVITGSIKYAWVIRAPSGSGSNKVMLRIDLNNGYGNGDRCWSSDSGSSWDTVVDDYDYLFVQYGEPPPPPPPPTEIYASFNVGSDDDDGFVYSLESSYPSARTNPYAAITNIENGIVIGQSSTGFYSVYRGFVKFNTSAILSTYTIVDAQLGVYITSFNDLTATDFIVRIRNWTGDTPITTGDFNSYGNTNYDDGTFSTSSFPEGVFFQWFNITISDFSIVKKGGNTTIAIVSDRDMNAIQPTGYETFIIEEVHPILYVHYLLSGGCYVNATSNVPSSFFVNGTQYSTPQSDLELSVGSDYNFTASQYFENSTGSWEFSNWLVNSTDTYTTREIDLAITGNSTLYITYNPMETFSEPVGNDKLLSAYEVPSENAKLGAVNKTDMVENFNLTDPNGVGYWWSGITYENYTYLGSISEANITKVDNRPFTVVDVLSFNLPNYVRDMVVHNDILYASVSTSPGRIYLIALSNFSLLGWYGMYAGENDAYTLATDGTSLYVGFQTGQISRINFNNFANNTIIDFSSDPDNTGIWNLVVDPNGYLYASLGNAIVKIDTHGDWGGSPPEFGTEVARLRGFGNRTYEMYAQSDYMLFVGSQTLSGEDDPPTDVWRIGLRSFTIVQNISFPESYRRLVTGLYALNDTVWIGFGYSYAVITKYNYVTQESGPTVRMAGASSGSTTLTFILNATASAARIEGFDIQDSIGRSLEGDWLIREIKWYNFILMLRGIDDTALISFYDGADTPIVFGYDFIESKVIILNSNDSIIVHPYPTITYDSSDTQRFNITFQALIRITVIDKLNVTFYAYANTTYGYEIPWTAIATNYCHLYSKGGIQLDYGTSGYAGRIAGGDVFDLYAGNNSYVYASSVFLYLQHLKMLPTFKVETTGSNIAVLTASYTVYVKFEGEKTWTQEMKVTLTDIFATAGTQQWIVWETRWYDYANNEIKAMNISAYWPDPVGSSQTAKIPMWIDLWINRQNESSVMGARVGSYYYPMTDSSNAWLRWLTGSNWGIQDQLDAKGLVFTTMRDVNGTIKYAKNIELIKVEMNLSQWNDPSNLFTGFATDYNVFDLTFGEHEYEGIQTPPFEETRTPVIASGGFLGAIWGAISWLGSVLGPIFGTATWKLWSYFVGFLDTIFGWFGLPGFFSNFMGFLASGFTWLGNSILYILNILAAFFTFIGIFVWKLLNWVVTIFLYFGQMITLAFAILGGAYTAGVNIWNDYQVGTWILLIIILYPIYLVFLWEEEGFDAVISQLTFIFNVFMMGVNFLLSLIHYVASGINYIIEAIPVVE